MRLPRVRITVMRLKALVALFAIPRVITRWVYDRYPSRVTTRPHVFGDVIPFRAAR